MTLRCPAAQIVGPVVLEVSACGMALRKITFENGGTEQWQFFVWSVPKTILS